MDAISLYQHLKELAGIYKVPFLKQVKISNSIQKQTFHFKIIFRNNPVRF